MKKRITALAGLLLAGSVCATSVEAAEATCGTGYQVIAVQSEEELTQILEGLGAEPSDLVSCCPMLSGCLVSIGCERNAPGTDAPETNAPEADDASETDLPYAEQILALVNTERAKEGLSALELDISVTAAANVRAVEITQSFAHTRPDGSSFSTALTEMGVTYRGCGENIAWGQRSPEEVMEGWMNSSGHRANILNASYTKLGVGHYQDASGVNYWVQLFVY